MSASANMVWSNSRSICRFILSLILFSLPLIFLSLVQFSCSVNLARLYRYFFFFDQSHTLVLFYVMFCFVFHFRCWFVGFHRECPQPSNICINQRGQAKLTDFGVASEQHGSVGHCETFVGTFCYMSVRHALLSRGCP